tara:strand:- start:3281 stop:3943 length:663 start_codon:yes stop_codon:yes gene_type:complete
MDYNYEINKFCEKKVYPYRPEYINAFTSIFLCYISYKALSNPKLKKTVTLVYWTIFVNGIGSFLYHWNSWYIFKLFDEFSMVLPIWISISDILFSLKYPNKYLGLLTLFNVLLLVFDVFIWFDAFFPVLFGIEIGLIVPLYYQSIKQLKDTNNTGLKGIFICIISAITWITTEHYCNEYMIFGHAIWHIGMGIGTNQMIEYFNKLEYDNNGSGNEFDKVL